MIKHPQVERRYRNKLEISTIAALLICHLVLLAFRYQKIEFEAAKPSEQHHPHNFIAKKIVIKPEPRYRQKPPRPPEKPTEPVPTKITEAQPDDEPVEAEPDPEPTRTAPPPEPAIPPFLAYETPPAPVGGLAAIQRHVRYPESAKRLFRQGTVIVNVLVGVEGEILATKVLRSTDFGPLDKAAVEAIESVEWLPALQRKTAVEVWVAIPVIFTLK